MLDASLNGLANRARLHLQMDFCHMAKTKGGGLGCLPTAMLGTDAEDLLSPSEDSFLTT